MSDTQLPARRPAPIDLGWTADIIASLGTEARAGVRLLVDADINADDWFDTTDLHEDDDLLTESGNPMRDPFTREYTPRAWVTPDSM